MNNELKGSDLTRAMLARGENEYGVQFAMTATSKLWWIIVVMTLPRIVSFRNGSFIAVLAAMSYAVPIKISVVRESEVAM